MVATAPTTSPRRGHDETVRMRNADLLRPLPTAVALEDPETTRLGAVGKTVRLPSIVIGNVTNTVRQRYADLNSVTDVPPSRWQIARILLVLLLASMPILGISVDVFGLVPQSITSVVIIALTGVLGAIVVFAPHRTDMIVGRGLVAGMVACIVYDAARLFAVHVLGLMEDFIPVMGSWVTGEPDTTGSAAVGYVWRYIETAAAWGGVLRGRVRAGHRPVVEGQSGVRRGGVRRLPTWAGLIATVALAPRGEQMMFPLTPATVTITLVGHLIFGFVLGLAFLKAPRGGAGSEWPWPPLPQILTRRRRTV
ncbi:hypothetical protein [Mycolicibacterium monacense]|uniref:Uncharacterized protein n=1 Tax=Mycolicibacterium monacense TaxID=85693 RepID=A0AAD1J0X3_MYCMB|nr:hypothetical protein [Mycolicibacterium monacense]BBZ64556.1 hypothetical protein MMON_58570 [Mycolicibacterium monacense]